jgi:hypothetical protein
MLTVNLNGCLHRVRNLVSVPHSIAVRRLTSMILRNNARYSTHKDSMVTTVLL